MTDRETILQQVRAVPKLPAIVARVQQRLQDPHVEFEALAKDIELDPGLTANILQLANSPLFGCSREINSLRQAVVRLGTSRIMQLVICEVVGPIMKDSDVGYGMCPDDLWRHSIGVAMAAERVAQRSGLDCAPDVAFTAGLLHDVGKIVLGGFLDVDDAPIYEKVEGEGCEFDEAERSLLDLDHAEVSGLVLERWRLPAELVAAARNHHRPGDAPEPDALTDVVHVADILCINAGLALGYDGLNYRLDDEAAARVGLSVAEGEAILCEVALALEELMDMFPADQKGTTHGSRLPAC